MELKSFASCMAREICRRCLNKQMNATMEADPIQACNLDDPSSVATLRRVDATGFIRLNALRLKVAAKVHAKKK